MPTSNYLSYDLEYINRLLMGIYGVSLYQVQFNNGNMTDLRRSNIKIVC